MQGTIDTHTHLTAFEFIGGDFHCGRPWSPFGVTVALPDCAAIQGPQGTAAPVQNFVDYGAPVHPHDTVGWPTFKDWPGPTKLSYEGTYYTGHQARLPRRAAAHRHRPRGQRGAVHDHADEAQPLQRHGRACTCRPRTCTSSRTTSTPSRAARARAGSGSSRTRSRPGKVINQGKLAIVEGVEVSHVFDCGETNHVARLLAPAKVDAGLDEVRRLGVSSFYPVHKFDNAFGGTKMDGGTEGVLINGANHLKTGHFWDVKTCTGKEQDSLAAEPGRRRPARRCSPARRSASSARRGRAASIRPRAALQPAGPDRASAPTS